MTAKILKSYPVSVSSAKIRGFTLVELMVSMSVLAMLMLVIATVIGTVQRSWRSTRRSGRWLSRR